MKEFLVLSLRNAYVSGKSYRSKNDLTYMAIYGTKRTDAKKKIIETIDTNLKTSISDQRGYPKPFYLFQSDLCIIML